MKTLIGIWPEVPDGVLSLKLTRYALISGTMDNAPRTYSIQLDDHGTIPLNTRVWGNDELMFEGSEYRTIMKDVHGDIMFGPQSFAICGTSPISLNKLISLSGLPPEPAPEFTTVGITSDNMFGQPQDGQLVMLYTSPYSIEFPPNFAMPNSYVTVGTAPLGFTTYTVWREGSAEGTIQISPSLQYIFTASGFTLLAGQRLTITAPNPMDVALSDVAITLVGTRLD